MQIKAISKWILTGKKKYFLSKDIMVKRVPQREHLRVKELINFASENCDIKSYLPDYDYDKELQREWLWNILNTLVPEQFHAFVSMALQSREKKLTAQKGLKVNALPQFLDLFSKSKMYRSLIEEVTSFWEMLLEKEKSIKWKLIIHFWKRLNLK